MNPPSTSSCLLSIVIPTRNRFECASACIAAARMAAPQAQIVIADSSDGGELEQHVAGLLQETGSIDYRRSPRDANVVENFEFALTHCVGEYVIFVGDDDLVGPQIEDVAAWAHRAGIDAVVPYGNRFGVAYYWPGVDSKYFGDAYSGKVFVWSASGHSRAVDPMVELRHAEQHVGRGLALLPRIYHGLVRRATLMEVKARFGALFGGVSPDIYSAILIAKVARRVVHLDFPFFIPGASPRSEAGSGAARTDRVSFDDSPYLNRFKGLRWNPLVPRFFSPYTVWGYSMVEGMQAAGLPVTALTYARIHVRCLAYCFSYRQDIFAAVSQARDRFGVGRVAFAMGLAVLEELRHTVRRVLPRLLAPRAGGWARRYGGVDDSVAALRLVTSLVKPFRTPEGGG
ncbi:glycosyltransferase [Roseateles sp.]|uniref:glycosyltransferase n=1 Tax=Roseateles sp. TaxID=1971397 RepID=UPI0025DEA44E|nr:glycosyltransferase [Roseateles sp.]MBV8033828.1 glycosyltransferase [Roseateles sp.]